MKRGKEMATERVQTEIRSALEQLSLMVKLKHSRQSLTPSPSQPPPPQPPPPSPPPPAAEAPPPAAALPPSLAEAPRGVVHDAVLASATASNDNNDHVSYSPTRPFLSFCSLILQVLDKIGPTMAVLRRDVYQNIKRLELQYESDPATYCNLVEMLEKEACERSAKKQDSCSKALVWLTRSVDLTTALLQKLVTNPLLSLEEAVEDSYEATLKPWHGWISSAAYKVALKLLPDNKTFINLLKSKDQDLDSFRGEVQSLIALLVPLLEDMHSVLVAYGLERVKCT